MELLAAQRHRLRSTVACVHMPSQLAQEKYKRMS